MRHSEEDFQRDIDLVIISKEADGRIPRATQKIPAKLYVDVGPVLEDDIGIVIITRARDIVEVPQSHLEIIGKQFLGDLESCAAFHSLRCCFPCRFFRFR